MRFLNTKKNVSLQFSALFIVLCYIIFNDLSYYYKLVPFVAYFIYFLALRYIEKKEKILLANNVLRFYILFRFIMFLILVLIIIYYGMIFEFFSLLNFLTVLFLLETFIFSKLSSKMNSKNDSYTLAAFSFSILSIIYLVVELSVYYLANRSLSFYMIAGCIVCMLLRLLLIRYFDL